MKKSRVKITCGLFATIILISALLSGLLLAGNGQYVPRSSDYSTYSVATNPPTLDFSYPLANYSLVRGGKTIGMFDRMGLASFESGINFTVGATLITHTDKYGRLDVHETPTTVIQYQATENNTLKFELAEGTGATRRGDSIVVGNPDASGVFLMLSDSAAAISGQDLLFTMPPGSRVIFRADTGLDNVIGTAVADGRVAAEMYLLDGGYTVNEDVVSYGDTWMYTVAPTEKLVEVQLTGDPAGRAVVLHVNEPYLDYSSADDLAVKLDGRNLKSGAGMAETLWETGQDARYFAAKTAGGFDIVIYIPQGADGSVITITAAEADFGIDGIITLLAAIGIVAVAVVALIKSE